MAKFRVRARTVDMLGRQQIAGIPTAISELFKNAHDAYARTVEVDYFRDDGLFVLRDDGIGMTHEDFEQRWLTLGTESKIGSPNLKLPRIARGQSKRPILGEKGIGRLAIAIIGPQVLVLSRANIKGKPSDKTVAAYIHWGLFELPGLDLDDITIPVRELPGGTLPDKNEVGKMVADVASTLDKLAPLSDPQRIKAIQQEMDAFNADPLEYSKYLKDPALTGSGCGTHFYIIPADAIIKEDIDDRQADNKATRFEKNLIGFTNTMTPDHRPPAIIARFRDHPDKGPSEELIGERAFFTPDEYKGVDHHFLGRFDEFGQFQGKAGIYQMEPEDYILNWSKGDGQPTECGPFDLSFAYMQGTARESLVPPEEHARLRRKLDRYGGLYIYRDGIRVQPYGDSDYDWLDIERNRTLGAGYYFYSYRRIFGVIELSRAANKKLTEKAGREGFRENNAYRQLRSILMNFFIQTAGDFFREDGERAKAHIDKKDELNRNEEIRRMEDKQARKKRKDLEKSLQRAFNRIDEGQPELVSKEALTQFRRKMDQVLTSDIPNQAKARELIQIEQKARQKLHDLRKDLAVTKPRGVGLSRKIANEWASYQVQMDRLASNVFEPTEAEIEKLVSQSARSAKVPLDDIARLLSAVSECGNDALKEVRKLRRDVDTLSGSIASTVKEKAHDSFNSISDEVKKVKTDLERIQSTGKDSSDLAPIRAEFVKRIVTVSEAEMFKLVRLKDQLSQVTRVWDQGSYDTTELTEALGEELEELKARQEADLELAQVGMALNTINHEFDKTVGSLRKGLRELKAWADANSSLNDLYQKIRISFDHLDEYLTLFTPLDRRLHRTRINITGKQIYEFLSTLLQTRLMHHKVSFIARPEFLKASITSFPSSVYPPFINLIDNAIFWVQRNHDRRREIVLDTDGSDLLVRDNGPGVSSRDRNNIFIMNFTRKPGGRGMGLHISRETLARIGLRLTLDPSGNEEGAVFRITSDDNLSVH